MVVLGVEKSLSNKKWLYHPCDENLVLRLIQKYDFPEVLARILVSKGILEGDVLSFLKPTLKDNLPDPESLKDVRKTAERFADEIIANKPIGIMGDYDVDGATSSALLNLFLKSIGCQVEVFIPDRDDGYGPNKDKMKEYYDKGIRLVATVDCGTTAFEPIDYGTSLGMDVIIIDHHEPEKTLPNAYAIVNPKRLDEDAKHSCHSLAAVGVVFLVVIAINKLLRERGFYQKIKEPNLKQWLDLVAFGTVCDVVPLKGVNRLFVRYGLNQMQVNENVGIKALTQIANIREQINAYHLGYILGPRINAGGRVGTSDLGMHLLCATNIKEALQLANQLEDLNVLRREIEGNVLLQAQEQAQESIKKGLPFILVKGENWHQGVVGIVAGRLKEQYNLPSFVLSIEGNDAKGSSRSVQGVDLGALVITALQQGILSRGGGHPMAAGFSLEKGKIEAFEQFLKQYIENNCHVEADAPMEIFIDDVLNINAVGLDLLKKIACLEPYGEGNPEPTFAIQDVILSKTIITKNGHIICKFSGKGGGHIDAVCFRAQGTPMGDALLSNKPGSHYHIAGQLRIDSWNNDEKVQLIVEDVAVANG